MKRFLTNKYPVKYNGKDTLPTGTIFTIGAINGNMFELVPARKVADLDYPIMVDCQMLDRGFTEQDHIGT
ncbi:hypothetical protein [uncultured Zhongshania sp.]|uniref:hypothetical protein n=1 Tax=uncultured Zhongshania sp. TaxID=1642288 RepID=UPI0030DCC52C